MFERKLPECRIEFVCNNLKKVLDLLNRNEIKSIIIFTYTGFKIEISLDKLRIESSRKFESTYIIDLGDKEVEIEVRNMQINVYEKPKPQQVETKHESKRFEIQELDLSDEEWNKLINALKKAKGFIKVLRVEKDFVEVRVSSYVKLWNIIDKEMGFGFRVRPKVEGLGNGIVRIYRKKIVLKFK